MSYRESLERSIAETELVIEKTQRYYETSGHPAYLVDLEIGSLQKRLEDLKRQLSNLEVARDREHMIIKFHPPNLPSGKISARTFSSIIGGIQAISDSIANSKYNQPSAQGRIPADILNKHTWLITAQEAGSYAVTMEMNHDSQVLAHETTQDATVAELFSLFTSSHDHDLLFETVSRLGVRALRHYRDWARHIRDEGTPIEIEWTSAHRGTDYVYFDSDKASRIFEVLTNISESEPEEVEVTGKLTGADSRLKTFRLEATDGHFLSGTVLPDQVRKVGAIVLESNCRVRLLKQKTVYMTTGKEKISWTLQDIEVIE